MKKLKLVSSIALVAGALAAPVHAETETQVIGVITLDPIQGGSSNIDKVIVGASNVDRPPIHTLGKAGIGAGYTLEEEEMVDFIGLAEEVPADRNRVHSLDMAYYGPPKTHRDLGVFHFAQVGSHDVWFGEWSQTGASNDPTRTVYYVGANADNWMTRRDIVSYAVTGINRYATTANNNLLYGYFTVEHSASTLVGSIEGPHLYIDIGTVIINENATFATGSSFAYGKSGDVQDRNGMVSGRFYNGQADLAGMVTFGGRHAFDTAFGGVRLSSTVIGVH